ncbi:MAG: sulfotransferase [Dokdonella sp.]
MTKSQPPPANIRKFLLDGTQCIERNDLGGAERCANFAMALAPDHPRPVALFGKVLRRQGRTTDAVSFLREAVAKHPLDVELRQELAGTLADHAQLDSAIDQYREALALRQDARIWFELGTICDRNSQAEHALHAAQQSIRLAPQHMPSRFLLARALTSTGRIEEAAREYRSLTRRPAQAAKAWFGLLDLKTVRHTDQELFAIEKLESDPRTTESDRIFAGFALGQAYESAGRYRDAVHAVRKANRLMRGSIDWSAESHTANINQIADAFAKPVETPSDESGFPVVFIVGMPRSGSSLVEQILAAHPDMVGAGELPYVELVIAAESLRRGQEFPQWAAHATEDDWRRLGKAYLRLAGRWHEMGRFTDKMPANWKYVAALRRMLPAARFIFTERDLLETCWSCHKQMFSPGCISFSYDWAELAQYAKDCQSLWRVWENLHPERCRVQSHEALQADPEGQVRELLTFCGLAFDPACVDFHSSKRVVRTASAAQVREPLRRNTARAARYGEHLMPLAEALGDVISRKED